MSILPPEVRAGYVYDRVLRAIGDRPYDDDRLPDGIPAQGKVIFRPKTSVKQVVSGGRGVTVTREPVTCTIHQGADERNDPDASKGGLLIDEAGAVGGVWLVVGEWTVEYHMEDRYSNIPNEEIIVTEEHTKDNPLDVALASELTPTPTQKFVVNEQVYVDTLAARDEVRDNLHDMVISGEVVGDDLHLSQHGGDSIVAGNVRGPRGPQGIQGPMGSLELIGGDNPAITVDTSVGTRVFVGDTMIYGDTGVRDISGSTVHQDNFIFSETQPPTIRRENHTVTLEMTFSVPDKTLHNRQILALSPGFNADRNLNLGRSADRHMFFFTRSGYDLRTTSSVEGANVSVSYTWTTSAPWPTYLPGIPA